MQDKLYTPEQIASELQLHHLTVLKLIKNGQLRSIKLGRIYRIRESDLNNFLDKNSSS